MTFSRRQFLLTSGAALWARPANAGTQVIGGLAFGSTWRAVLPQSADPAMVHSAVETVIRLVDAEMSPYRADSGISRFNRAKSGRHRAGAAMCGVVAEALSVARLTDGAFDPTVGPLVSRYGFGPIGGTFQGPYGIEVDDGCLIKRNGAETLDLCGIAKGYALDQMAEALRTQGIENALLELGGEVLAPGRHPDGREWQVGIERPETTPTAFQRIISPGGSALATSGTAVNSYRIGGRRISHLIDPHTRQPAEDNLASVSVLAPTAMQADALATGFFVMGPDAGGDLADRMTIPALFILPDGSERMAGGFNRHVVK